MKKRQCFKKAFTLGLVAMLGLTSLTGCGKNSSDENISTNTDAYANDSNVIDTPEEVEQLALEEGMNFEAAVSGELPTGWTYNPATESDYKAALDSINLSSQGPINFSYGDYEPSYPFNNESLYADGWVYSDESFDNKQAKSDNYSEIAVYKNDKYDNFILNMCGQYPMNGETLCGILGQKDILDKYGCYAMSCEMLDFNDNNDSNMPQFKVNGISIFETNFDTMLKSLNESDTCEYVSSYVYSDDEKIELNLDFDKKIYYRYHEEETDSELYFEMKYLDDKCISFYYDTFTYESE